MTIYQKFNLIRLALAFPGVTLKKLGQISIWHNKSFVDFPALLNFFLYSGCNLKCSMCGQWRRKSAKEQSSGNTFLPLKNLEELVDEATAYSPEIYIWGGEPTLHPNFAEFIAYIKKKKLICTVNTNGTMLKELAGKIIEAGIDSIDVSLDGPMEVHDSIRGVQGTYVRIMDGLKELEKRGLGKKILTKAVITLSKTNLEHIEKLLWDLESNSAIDMSIIQLGWYTTRTDGGKYEQELKEGFGGVASSWRGFEDNKAHERSQQCRDLIQKIRNGPYKKPIMFFPNLKGRLVERYYTNHSDTLGRIGCRALYREMNIMPNGDVVICGDYPDIVIGCVYEKTLKEIWMGEPLHRFREHIDKKGLFSICTRCCGFFKWSSSILF